MRRGVAAVCLCLALCSCFPQKRAEDTFKAPGIMPAAMVERINAGRDGFVPALDGLIRDDAAGLLVLVDKANLLPGDAVPTDLVPLGDTRSYAVSRAGLSLRRDAEAALERMAAAALKDGVTLVASSSYRSWEYQKGLYERNVRELGKEVADRESAPPGASQHQLGTAVDFGSITDDFARTRAGKWLAAHAGEYGWSLSFPDGYEAVTGYRWESWHYRYVGVEAALIQKEWFGDVQQYMIVFIDAWRRWRAAPAD